MFDQDLVSTLLDDLEEALCRLAAQHRALQLGQFGSLSQRDPPLTAAAASTRGPYSLNCDNVGLNPFCCGQEPGIALGVCTGNFKDMGCAVASGAAVRVLADTFGTPLLSEADLVPALRRAALETHDSVLRFQDAPLGSHEFGTCNGVRSNLKGIGTSMTAVAATPARAYGVHIGEGKAYLLRHGKAKKLTIEHTLANEPGYRNGELAEFPTADLVVLRVLGLGEEFPKLDVFRTDLQPGDRIIVGNLALHDDIVAAVPAAQHCQSAEEWTQRLLRAIHSARQWCPASVGCITLC